MDTQQGAYNLQKATRPRKRLVRKVELRFFCDDATGEYGLTHAETIEGGFNAFWGGIGMFHDVWEHAHEHTHKYFRGRFAMNIGGEMTAMGAMWYYQNSLGLHSKRMINPNSIWDPADLMRRTTQDDIQEAIQEANCQFGSCLESNVPRQRPVNDSELEYQIEKMWAEIKTFNFKPGEYSEDNEKEYAQEYKASCSFRKIADLHRFGYRYAERLVPYSRENWQMMYDFIDFWNAFCKNNVAKDLQYWTRGITFYIYKQEGQVTWRAKLVSSDYMIPDQWIKSTDTVYAKDEQFQY